MTVLVNREHAREDDRSVAPIGAERVDGAVLANAIRALAMDAVQKANSGHPGMPMGMADAATVLFSRFVKIDPRGLTGPIATASFCRLATVRCCNMRCIT